MDAKTLEILETAKKLQDLLNQSKEEILSVSLTDVYSKDGTFKAFVHFSGMYAEEQKFTDFSIDEEYESDKFRKFDKTCNGVECFYLVNK